MGRRGITVAVTLERVQKSQLCDFGKCLHQVQYSDSVVIETYLCRRGLSLLDGDLTVPQPVSFVKGR
jgi:hypothetical protein